MFNDVRNRDDLHARIDEECAEGDAFYAFLAALMVAALVVLVAALVVF